jgi:hypothetical protein
MPTDKAPKNSEATLNYIYSSFKVIKKMMKISQKDVKDNTKLKEPKTHIPSLMQQKIQNP